MSYWEKGNHSWSHDSLRHILTPTQKSQDLFYYIQEIGYFKANKPYYTERENLPSYLMKYTLSGEGRLHYQGQQYHIKAGDVFFIDCLKYQRYETISDEPWEMDWIHFNGANSSAFFQEYMRNQSPVFSVKGQPFDRNPIHYIIQQLLDLTRSTNARTNFHVSVLIHDLLNQLMIQKFELDFEDTEIPAYIKDVKLFLDEALSQHLSLEDLEARFHINKYQIAKDFSKYIGTPPIDYQLNQKISHAKDLLRYSKLTIQEISLEIGIENFAYFSRLFKKRTGLTPSLYRKNG